MERQRCSGGVWPWPGAHSGLVSPAAQCCKNKNERRGGCKGRALGLGVRWETLWCLAAVLIAQPSGSGPVPRPKAPRLSALRGRRQPVPVAL